MAIAPTTAAGRITREWTDRYRPLRRVAVILLAYLLFGAAVEQLFRALAGPRLPVTEENRG